MRLHQSAAREGTNSPLVPPTSPRGGYQYRGKSSGAAEPEDGTKANIEKALHSNRQALSQALAAIRAITVHRNEQIAEAIWDGVPPRTVAVAASMSITEARSIGVAFEEMLPPGAPSDVHVAAIMSATEHLRGAESDRCRLEHQRNQVIVTAHRLRLYDEYEISTLTGIAPEEIRRMTRGTRVSTKKRNPL